MRARPAARAATTDPVAIRSSKLTTSALMKPLLEVGVDHTGRPGGRVADVDGPRTGLLGPGREERLQAESGEADVHQLLQSRFMLAVTLQELPGIVGLDIRASSASIWAHSTIELAGATTWPTGSPTPASPSASSSTLNT